MKVTTLKGKAQQGTRAQQQHRCTQSSSLATRSNGRSSRNLQLVSARSKITGSSVPRVSAQAKRYSTSAPKVYGSTRSKDLPLSVFSEFTALANEHKAVNLGQGFPDFAPPQFVKDALKEATDANVIQYTRAMGHVPLVQALARHYSPLLNREVNPMTEVVTTAGATEAIFTTMQSLLNPGDEVILIEPFYDSYSPSVVMAGGVPKYVALKAPANKDSSTSADWKLDMNDLKAAITPKTKILILNTPSNIPGKVYSREELEQIAALAKEHDFLIMADEVYDKMVYDPINVKNSKKIPALTRMASLPGMFERTVSVGSAGKTFSVTGLKCGWVVAPSQIADRIANVHQYVTFSITTPVQQATAIALEKVPEYYGELHQLYTDKRNFLYNELKNHGLNPVECQGSYFLLANFDKVDPKYYTSSKSSEPIDFQFCKWLIRELGVAAIPISPFYSSPDRVAGKYVRFTFCKKDEVLQEGMKRLEKLKKYFKTN